MADPPSLFPEYMEQITPGIGVTNLSDGVIVQVDPGPEIVIEVSDD
jgi:hypothetical protein